MGSWLRWTTGVASRVDAMVSRIENHDGLVSVAIRDAREARARARVQLKRVRDDGRRMEQRRASLEEAEQRWKERALRVSGADEQRALECMKRMRRAAQERANLAQQAEEHGRVEEQLACDIGRIDAHIEQLVQKRNLLRTRQSRAEALAVVQPDDGGRVPDVEETLERWEINVSRVESDSDCDLEDGDRLERTLDAEEEHADLREELGELLRASAESTDPGREGR